ncbi:CheR family methyltransferase [Sphingomonas sp. Leaf343]|uniref:CheR family methyltransferase n=1 Tax=Sphingomonas sp. Leaf343 TaxID=1736345 RepID=UPI000701DE72|nr:protein-glutamate O-methyltransferase CheR [Sphingomonas sp. Leaf343]KQR81263.1 chemotaxis protein CheR [Sphingomonas sp. Leaf343]
MIESHLAVANPAAHPGASGAGASAGTLTVLARLLEARTGQQIASSRAWRLDVALKPLLRDREMETLDQLVDTLLDGSDPALGDRIIDALVNGESSFFRDQPVFDAIAEAVTAIAPDRRARIWSAGCATGQEALSLAMMFAETAGDASCPELVATDVSEAALARARTGRYNQFEIQRGLPVRRMMRWFDSDGADWIAKPELTRLVQYRQSNLVTDAPPAGRFDVILCRNVLFYLAAGAKAKVFASLAAALRPGGLLVLGAGETVIGQTGLFVPSMRYRGFYEHAETNRHA